MVCNLPFTALYFAVNCFFFGLTLDITCSKDAISSRFFFYFCKKIFLIMLQGADRPNTTPIGQDRKFRDLRVLL